MDDLNSITVSGTVEHVRDLQGKGLGLRIKSQRSYSQPGQEVKIFDTYVTVNMWGDRGRALIGRVPIGARIIASGRISGNSYADAQGQNRYEIQVDAMHLLPLAQRQQQAPPPVPQQQPLAPPPVPVPQAQPQAPVPPVAPASDFGPPPAAPPPQPVAGPGVPADDDIPF